MKRKVFILIFCLFAGLIFIGKIHAQVLDNYLLDSYVEKFNQQDEELYVQYVSNDQAKDFLEKNIPLFESVTWIDMDRIISVPAPVHQIPGWRKILPM